MSGAAGGIGSAISEGLAYASAEVALCGHSVEKCQILADLIIANGGEASVHHMDVTDIAGIHACVDDVVARYGKIDVLFIDVLFIDVLFIDVLFNVAGINERAGLLDVIEEIYDRIMNNQPQRCVHAQPGRGSGDVQAEKWQHRQHRIPQRRGDAGRLLRGPRKAVWWY